MKARLHGLAWLTVLGGCAAPITHFHSLLAPPAATVPASPVVSRWDLLPVTVPAQVDQPQWVVRMPDQTLAVLENERWAAPLPDEIRAALAERLRLAPSAAVQARSWRIAVDVQRFDSVPGRFARLQVEWSLRETDGGTIRMRCRQGFEQAAGNSYPALAAAHRALVQQLGDVLAGALRRLDAGGSPGCS